MAAAILVLLLTGAGEKTKKQGNSTPACAGQSCLSPAGAQRHQEEGVPGVGMAGWGLRVPCQGGHSRREGQWLGTRASPPTPALARAVPGGWADFLYLFSLHSWRHQLPGPPGPSWGPAPASSGPSLLSSPDSCSRTPCPAGPAAKTQSESSHEEGGSQWGGDPRGA